MSVGGRFVIGGIRRQSWIDEAAKLEVGGPYLLRVVKETANQVEGALPAVEQQVAEVVDGHALANVVREVRKGLRIVRWSVR